MDVHTHNCIFICCLSDPPMCVHIDEKFTPKRPPATPEKPKLLHDQVFYMYDRKSISRNYENLRNTASLLAEVSSMSVKRQHSELESEDDIKSNKMFKYSKK